jgi:hypothetical protein
MDRSTRPRAAAKEPGEARSKWWIATERAGIPIAWVTDGTNRNNSVLLAPTLDDAKDCGYDSNRTRERFVERGINDAVIAERKIAGAAGGTKRLPMGLRWPVARPNSWLSNFGQLRLSIDRFISNRVEALALAITLIITVKLMKWQKRQSPSLA